MQHHITWLDLSTSECKEVGSKGSADLGNFFHLFPFPNSTNCIQTLGLIRIFVADKHSYIYSFFDKKKTREEEMRELYSTHRLLHKPHINRHEFRDESLQVVDGLVPSVEAMLIFGGQMSDLHFQLSIAILDEFL